MISIWAGSRPVARAGTEIPPIPTRLTVRTWTLMHKHTQFGVERGFFDHPREGSRVKQEIITKYFNAYMNKMARGRIVGYADLFAGPGLYRTGEKSTPILTCERVVEDERLRNCVRLWFNEADPDLFQNLKRNIA